MTERPYLLDSYAHEFEARVGALDTSRNAVVLDRTYFYPGGGGQPIDRGTIGGTPVIGVEMVGTDIWHKLDGSLPSDSPILSCALDWDRRYKLMRTHTAMHVLCGVVFRDYGALVTGGDMVPLRGRMDFEFAHLDASLVSKIEASVNAEIAAARDVRIQVLPREQAFQIPDLIRTKINLLPAGIQEVRTIEIAGLDLQADGGTHVRNTREVGCVRVVDYKSKGASNKRIYLEVMEPSSSA